jgi:hypothetical protein
MEVFILKALDAYKDSNGDIDKFELLLRRSMSASIPGTISTNLNITPELVEALQGVDLETMTDEEALSFAKKVGLLTTND